VTRGAVYHHFASKQALFEAVLELQEARVTAKVDPGGLHRAIRCTSDTAR
jgi:AcrR family transcriptional regulator